MSRSHVELDALEMDECCAELIDRCQRCHVDISLEQARLCVRHLLLVLRANRISNLTRITDLRSALVLHVLDSLLLSAQITFESDRTILDMGTGAGYPGIPLHILTRNPTVLVDSVQKKVDAVSSFIEDLSLSSISVCHARLEDHARFHRLEYPYVVARALAPLPTLVELATPLLRQGGRLIITKGSPSSTELSAGDAVADILGLSAVSVAPIELPDGFGHRTLLIYERTREPSVAVPRRNGRAQKKPLA